MSRVLAAASDNVNFTNVRIADGGTGSTTAEEALVNFNCIPETSLNQPNGIGGLDNNKKIDINILPDGVSTGIAISGPSSLEVSQTGTYLITNYDAFSSYELVAISGIASRIGDVISYDAPNIVTAAGFVINGRTIAVEITSPVINKPVFSSPVNGAVNIGSSIMLVANAFDVTGGSDTHAGSDWQISTDPNFSNIVKYSINDLVNKTSWVASGLLVSTTYYARVRYRGNDYGYGAWSDSVSFTTKSIFIPTSEEGLVIPFDSEADGQYGTTVAVSADGLRLAISAPLKNEDAVADSGAIYVYIRSGNSWIYEAKLTADDKASADYLGYSLAMSADGSRIVAGSYTNNAGPVNDSGAVYVFVRNGSLWTQEAKLTAPIPVAGNYFGYSVDIDRLASRIAVGSVKYDGSNATDEGGVYIFKRTDNTWAQEDILIATGGAADDYFGASVSFDGLAERLIVGAPVADSGGAVDSGSAYVFLRSGEIWSQEAKLVASDSTTLDSFGKSVKLSTDGTTIVVGAPNDDPLATTNAGAIYIYSRVGISWTQDTRLAASDLSAEKWFGYAVTMNEAGNIIVASALRDEAPETYTGSVYVFNKIADAWAEAGILIPADQISGDYYGKSITLSADGGILAVGASHRTNSGTSKAGGVYIFT